MIVLNVSMLVMFSNMYEHPYVIFVVHAKTVPSLTLFKSSKLKKQTFQMATGKYEAHQYDSPLCSLS